MAKNITLEILIAKKQQSENDKMKVVLFNSEVLGGTIEVVKHKARDVIKIMDSTEEKTTEAAYKAKQESQQQTVVASGNTTFTAEVQAVSESSSSYTPAPVKHRPTYSTNASSYPIGECTWGAKTLAPWAGDYWGNGAQWATSAAAAGFRTGSTPQVGAIACWNDGGYGHVAVVTAVSSSTSIQVSESNYGGNRTIGNKRGWFNPTTTSEGFVTYIYPN